MRVVFAAVFVCVTAVTMSASGRQADVPTRAKGAERVVVGVVTDVQPRFDVNEFGDRLIISQVWLRVDETLKGTHREVIPVDIEGGTIGDLTLRVSDLPMMQSGERAVFFLESKASGVQKPHGRGLGVLRIDQADRVAGSSVTLSEVRAMVRGQK